MSRRRTTPAEPVAAKVPAVTAFFWVVKLLTTGVGEAAADGLAHWNIWIAAVIGLFGFLIAIRWQFRVPRYQTGVYWFAVLMVAVFGTMGADALHIVFRVPYAASVVVCAVSLVIVFSWWHRSEGTLSIHSIVTRRRERFYWLAVLATFAMGTALGDFSATTLNLGFLGSIALYAGLIAIPALGWWRLGWNPVACFWGAYVMTRPLGASIADWLGKPASFGHGLGLGDGWVALVGTVLIVVAVAYLGHRGEDVQRDELEGSRVSRPSARR